ncbi:MAG: hypothetical protein L6Q98_04135 [Anaerolineae bacterium]|nr:hypothetical protein [Anaerolineae bacterium]NUQ07198.1 hypothetical protein [Anaerolineae bacterium]
MLKLLCIALAAMVIAAPAAAQTETPTPMCFPYASCFAATAYAIQTATAAVFTPGPGYFPPVQFEIIPSPTAIPTVTPVGIDLTPTLPTSNVIDYIATVRAQVELAPDDLSNPGLPILPQEDGGELFRYAKWLLSPQIAYEVFGSQFGDIIGDIRTGVILVLVMALVYFIIFVIVYIVRFVVWLISKIRALLPF